MGVGDDCPDTECGAGDDGTLAAAALSGRPAAVDPLAYSQEDIGGDSEPDTDAEPDAGSAWRYAVGALLVLVTAGAFVVTTALLMGQLGQHPAPSPWADAPISAPPVWTPPDTPAIPETVDPGRWNPALEAIAQHQTPRNPDAIYLADLVAAGFTVTDLTKPISDAHNICRYLSIGHTPAEAAAQNIVIYPKFSPAESAAYVNAAIDAYCPQYK